MTPEQLKDLLRKHNLRPNKTFGQNFLLDDFILQDMVDAAGVTPTDAVLEVGPGIATLTKYLLERAAFVLAIEKDPKFLCSFFKEFSSGKNFRYEIADILSFNFVESLVDFSEYRVVANIPYYITGKIIQLFVRAERKPKSITVLVQKEVAQNIAAAPAKATVLFFQKLIENGKRTTFSFRFILSFFLLPSPSPR